VFFLLTNIFAFIASTRFFVGHDWLDFIPVMVECQDSYSCLATMVVLRISFALTVFHLFMSLFMIGVKGDGFRLSFENGWWPLKLILYAGLLVLAFVIPNSFYLVFGRIESVLAGFFILIQLFLLVDWAYTLSNTLVGKMEDDQSNKWLILLFSISGFLYATALAMIITMYIFFTPGEGCGLNIFFITAALLCSIGFSILSISPKVQDANPRTGLLQSAMVTLYTIYLVFSAILSESPETMPCNSIGTGAGTQTWSLILGGLLTIVAVCYSTFRASSSYRNLVGETTPMVNPETVPSDSQEHEDEIEETTYNHSFFHLAFALGACYIAMLLTNWQTLTHNETQEIVVDQGEVSMWIKIVSSWITTLLYSWSLVAPVLFPNREWS